MAPCAVVAAASLTHVVAGYMRAPPSSTCTGWKGVGAALDATNVGEMLGAPVLGDTLGVALGDVVGDAIGDDLGDMLGDALG